MSDSSGSESDDSRSSSGSSTSSDSDTESDYSVGKPEPEGDSNCIGAEDMEEEARCLCLFCAEKFLMDSLASHLKSSHGLDLTVLRNKFSMDQLSFIKLVNFVRGEMKKVEEGERGAGGVEELIQGVRSCSKPLWDSEGYLKPVVEDDPLLSFWFDDLDDVVLENGHATEMEEISDDISRRLEGLNVDSREVKSKSLDYEHALSEACAKIDMMKEVMNRIMGDDTKMSKQEMLKRYTQSLSRTNQEYFESYDDNHIHAVMINDRQRTEAYRDAILKNSSDFTGKTVLDVGCGTSILSMFAVQAGATKVFAVDRSRIIEKAVEIVRENGFESRIECIQGTVESINLPVDKVDVIISEFMGYFLLFEGMLSSYIDARKKFLRPGGAMYPNTAEIFIIGIDDMSKYEKERNMWDDVYGFKMSAMKHKKKCTPLVETVAEEKCITSPCKILSLDLVACEYSDATFTSKFKLPATRSGFVTGITGYFDTGFTQGSAFQNVLSTAPTLPETHWYQTTFPLETPIAVKTGDTLDGTFECRPNLKNSRSLDIIIRIGEAIQTFLLD